MRYWFDTEYFDNGESVELISLGMVAEDGREFYAINAGFDWSRANDWLRQNVQPRLHGGVVADVVGSREEIAWALRRFLGNGWYGRPSFWGYYVAYDWVAFCQLFGGMLALPQGWPQFAFDLIQWYALAPQGSPEPRKPEEADDVHNALADARWTKATWAELNAHLQRIGSPLALPADC